VLFEGTMESSSGHLISLDMSQVEEYFIFPGQVGTIILSSKQKNHQFTRNHEKGRVKLYFLGDDRC